MSLADDFASLADDLALHAGEPVTYTRGDNGVSFTIAGAVRERATPQRQALADGRVDFTERPQDWCVRPQDLDYGAGPFEPARGDRITDAAGRVYELIPRDGEPEARPSDPYGKLWRLRTVRVA